jgi:tRNA G18 (ribose-2'-O)-methylase SpoU
MDAYNFSLLSPRKQAWKISGVIESLLASRTGLRPLTEALLASEREKLARYLAVFGLPDGRSVLPVIGAPLDESIRSLRKISYAVLDKAGVPAPETDFQRLKTGQGESLRRPTEHEVLLDDVRSPFNIGSVIRTAEAFGFNRVVLAGLAAVSAESKVKRAAMSSDEWIGISRIEKTEEVLRYLDEKKKAGFCITALEQAPDSRPIGEMTDAEKRILIVGNEEFGVDPRLIEAADEVYHIGLSGVKNSLNLAVAFGIAAKSVVDFHSSAVRRA